MSLTIVGHMADGASVCALDADSKGTLLVHQRQFMKAVCVYLSLPLSLEFRVTNIEKFNVR